MQNHNSYSSFYRLIRLLVPSSLSGTIDIGLPLAGMVITYVLARIHGTLIYDGLMTIQRTAVATPFDSLRIANWIDHNRFISGTPLMFFWAIVGIAVYMTVLQIMRAFASIINFREQMHYLHVNKMRLILRAFLHLGIRVLDAFGVYFVASYALRRLVPQALAAARAVAVYPAPGYIYQALLVTLCLIISLMAITILARLFMFRTRLFGT